MSIKFIAIDIGHTIIEPLSGNWYITNKTKALILSRLSEVDYEKRISKALKKARICTEKYIVANNIDKEFLIYKEFYTVFFTFFKDLDFDEDIINSVAYERAYDYNGLYRIINSMDSIIPMLARRYQLGLFSNTWPSVVLYLKQTGLLEYFSTMTLSYQIGVKKPSLESFSALLDDVKLDPNYLLLLDDNEICIKNATNLGLSAINVKTEAFINFISEELK